MFGAHAACQETASDKYHYKYYIALSTEVMNQLTLMLYTLGKTRVAEILYRQQRAFARNSDDVCLAVVVI